MLLPISHEETGVRDVPWVTFAFMAICVVVFLVMTFGPAAERARDTDERLAAAIDYFVERPYLAPPPELLPAKLLAQVGRPPVPYGVAAAAEQAELDRLTAGMLAAADRDPRFRYGLVPARPRAVAAFTHLFLHGGWLHLLGNLFFLYLTGPFVEAKWGRWRHAALLLVAGPLSGLAYVAHFPDLFRPLIGASGAIAAVMGAFLLDFARTRVRFLVMPLFPFPPYWRVQLRAWLVLSGWLGMNLLGAAHGDRVAPGIGDGVAYDAHIAGFVLGLLGAAVARTLQRRHAPPPDPRQERLAAIRAEVAAGRLDRAALLAANVCRIDPDDTAAALLWWSIVRRAGGAEEAAPALARVVRRELREGREDDALARWRDLERHCPEVTLEPPLELALLESLARRGTGAELAQRVPMLLSRFPASAPVPLLLRLLRLAATGGASGDAAAALARAALARPDLTAEQRGELERMQPAEAVAARVRSWLD